MAVWSCPHCGAVQAAAARCWVCHRSSTTCSTCRHFRTSLAADVGWCALDRKRRPLTGLELRGCWTERPAAGAEPAGPRPPSRPDPVWRDLQARQFVPVEGAPASAPARTPPRDPALEPEVVLDVPIVAVDPLEGWDARVSLFGDLER